MTLLNFSLSIALVIVNRCNNTATIHFSKLAFRRNTGFWYHRANIVIIPFQKRVVPSLTIFQKISNCVFGILIHIIWSTAYGSWTFKNHSWVEFYNKMIIWAVQCEKFACVRATITTKCSFKTIPDSTIGTFTKIAWCCRALKL